MPPIFSWWRIAPFPPPAPASSAAAPSPPRLGRRIFPWLAAPPLFSSSPSVVLTSRYVIGLLAFLICIDMTQVLGVLCYQLFLGSYFPWHLYPLMLNRAIELLALLCSDGHVPCVYSIAQIFLTILSMVICIQKQPCGRFNCIAALVLYGLLLTYQIFVAAMVIRISRITIIGDDEAQNNLNWLRDMESQRQMNGQPAPIDNDDPSSKEYDDFIIAIQQPDGEKYAIGKLCKDSVCVQRDAGEGPSEPLYGSYEGSTSHQAEASSSSSNHERDREEEAEERAFVENMTKEIIELLIEGSTRARSKRTSRRSTKL